MEEASLCKIVVGCGAPVKEKTLSSLQLKEGVRRGEITYLDMLNSE